MNAIRHQLKNKFLTLQKIIAQHRRFFLVIHPSPDADALGASYSLQEYIHRQNPNNQTTIYSIDLPSENLKPLFDFKKITTKLQLNNTDVLIFLDRGDVYYKLSFEKKLKKISAPPQIIVNIDHHTNTVIPEAVNIRNTTASSTSEIMYYFFQEVNFPIDLTIAQYLLNGIWFDTGGFRHNNTTPEVLEISGELMRKGASISKINRYLTANKPVEVLKLWGLALERVRVNTKTGMAVSYITKKDLEKSGVTIKQLDPSKLSELLNTIADTKFSLMLTEREENKVKASLRSDEYKKVDVRKIAQLFKGGGHKLASGFEVPGKIKPTKDGLMVE